MITPGMIEKHRQWLAGEDGGVRLDYHADLSSADLCGSKDCQCGVVR